MWNPLRPRSLSVRLQMVVRNDQVNLKYDQFDSGTHWQQLAADLRTDETVKVF